MKPVVAFAVTFGIALLASTGAKVMLTKPTVARRTAADSAAAADSIAQDSAKASAAKDSGATKSSADSSRKDTAVSASGADTTKAKGAVNGGVKAVSNLKSSVLPTPPTPAGTAPDTTVQASERRLAKIFTSMDAKQAAKVLANMADGDVKIILGYVGPRQAASIMAALPPERVALLSKLAMQGKQ